MRWYCGVLLVIAGATSAQAQLLWVGGGTGTSWEYRAQSAPDTDWLHNNQAAPFAFLALPISEGALLRFRAADLPRGTMYGGTVWPGRLRSYTVGVDYFLGGVIGQSMFSAGFGRYELHLQAQQPPAGVEDNRFGWYIGVGEWIPLTRRVRLTGEVTMHQTSHSPRPTIVTATAGLALSF